MRRSYACAIVAAILMTVQAKAGIGPGDLFAAPTASAVADAPVSLADAQSFDAPLESEVTVSEISDARRELANAVSAGKFLDGAVATVAVAILLSIVF